MNERLNTFLQSVKKYYAELSNRKKITLAVLASLILVSGLILTMVMQHDPQQMLYSDLHQEDSKAIAKKLSEQNIPYRVSEDASTITVAASQVYKARMELAKEGLPGQDVVGFEKFDGTTIGMSSYIQKIQYVRAIQGELTRSIQRLASVKTARVHISVPPKKTFMEEEEPPKASVVLELKMGMAPAKNEITGIAHLVASAVEGLKVSQITIVDTKGNFLHRPGDDTAPGVSSAFLELQRSIESEYEKRIEEMLTPIIGFGKVRAKVTAEIDPSRVNTTEETYDPSKAVPKTTVKTDEVISGSRPNPIGIPGSRSNLPGTEVQNPGIPMATSNTEKNSSNTHFAIPHKIQTIEKPSGSIKRLTVAVVVDGHYAKAAQPNAPETFSPRTEEELKRLQDLVANAVGFDTQRRDSITVSSLPFKSDEVEPTVEIPLAWYDLKELSKHGIRNGLISLVILMFFFLVLRPFLKWSVGDVKKSKVETATESLPKTVAELESAVRAEALPPGTENGIPAVTSGELDGLAANSTAIPNEGDEILTGGDPLNVAEQILNEQEAKESQIMSESNSGEIQKVEKDEKAEKEDLRAKILEKLGIAPKKGFRVVQEWLDESEPKPSEG